MMGDEWRMNGGRFFFSGFQFLGRWVQAGHKTSAPSCDRSLMPSQVVRHSEMSHTPTALERATIEKEQINPN